MKGFYNGIFHAAIGIICIFIWTLFYWQFMDNRAAFRDITIEIINKDSITDHIVLHVKGCNNLQPVINSASRIIKNTYTFVLSDQSVSSSPCFDRTVDYPLPKQAAPGPHTYQHCAEYRLNPIKTIIACNPPISFNVLPIQKP